MANMASESFANGRPQRRRRRRRQDKAPASARLLLDERVRGEGGFVAEDLWADLFPHLRDTPVDAPATAHVAITPWSPDLASPTSSNWTLVPVSRAGPADNQPPSTLRFSPSSPALQGFAAVLQRVAPSRLAGSGGSSSRSGSSNGIEILVLDAVAVPLDTIFVEVDSELARRMEAGEGTFFSDEGPRQPSRSSSFKGKGTASAVADGQSEQQRRRHELATAIRVALGGVGRTLHTGDLFALPLAPHPVTHQPPMPGRITLCEPVAQGLLVAGTKIVVTRTRARGKSVKKAAKITAGADGVVGSRLRVPEKEEDDGDDTSNDAFYSAAEEKYKTDSQAEVTESAEEATETEESEDQSGDDGAMAEDGHEEDSDEISDDSMDEMISLQAPTLPATAASGVSTLQAGTPTTVGRGRRTNGISTPASVFSSFTASTARPDRGTRSGRLFKAQGLMRPIHADLLHPKPAAEDDEEARVYVDVASLNKIGCFSGDWVRLEASDEPPLNGLDGFPTLGNLGAWGANADEEATWRPVKVFGLPEGYHRRPVTRIPSARQQQQHGGRRLSFFESQVQRSTAGPTAYMSPILLANLDSAPYVRISPLRRPQSSSTLSHHHAKSSKIPSGARPPYAGAVTVQQLRTPSTIDPAVQGAVLGGLKSYFAHPRVRLVRTGDLIAVPIDAQLGRTLATAEAGENGQQGQLVDDILGLAGMSTSSRRRAAERQQLAGWPRQHYDDVAWFRVGQIQPLRRSDSSVTGTPGTFGDDVSDGISDDNDDDEDDVWHGVACIYHSLTELRQSGTTTSRIPATTMSSWPYYLGLKRTAPPPPLDDPTLPLLVMAGRSGGATMAAAQQNVPHLDLPPQPPPASVSPLRRRLRDLIAAAMSPQAIGLRMPPTTVLLASTQRHVGKTTLVRDACADVGVHCFVVDAFDVLQGEAGDGAGGDAGTQGVLRARAALAASCGTECTALCVTHLDALTADKMVSTLSGILQQPQDDSSGSGTGLRLLIATTTQVDKVPDGVRALFAHELDVAAPDEREREAMLARAVRDKGLPLAPDVDLRSVALKTAALVAGDLADVVDRAVVAQRARLEELVTKTKGAAGDGAGEGQQQALITVRDLQLAGGTSVLALTRSDLDAAVGSARRSFAASLGAPRIPHVSWSDVGGLDAVRAAVAETIQLPLERPELFARGMKRRSGILFYGPPGTGKTLVAKAIATEYGLNFFSVKGPELLNMYIGESEANVRRVFARARDARPCVVFFDELDSVAPKRGNQGDSGGVMDRIVSQLLAELDGMSSGGGSGGGPGKRRGKDGDEDESAAAAGGVFVIGATNRPDLLDPALLRPGRFDKMLYLGVSDTHEKQLRILEALTRKFTLAPTVSLPTLARRLPLTYTGADFYALCSDAMLKAVTRQAARVDARIREMNESAAAAAGKGKAKHVTTAYYFDHYATAEDLDVVVEERDFIAAQRELVPSVSASELAHYERVRATFEGQRSADAAAASNGVQPQASTLPNGGGGVPRLAARFLTASGGQSAAAGAVGSGATGDGTGKGKGKESSVGKGKEIAVGKGKSKAVTPPVAGDESDYADEDEDGIRGARDMGKGKGKGKGKAVDGDWFEHHSDGDDDGLY